MAGLFDNSPAPSWQSGLGTQGQDDSRPRDRAPYQQTLRAAGAYLDSRDAQRFNLLETGAGFALRYQLDRGKPDARLDHMPFDQLLSLVDELDARRRRRLFGQPETNHRSYENVLRALGYELDGASVYSLLIDEIDEGLLLTYQYLNPSEGFGTRKRMVILGEEAMQAVLLDAASRREQRKRGILSLLAG